MSVTPSFTLASASCHIVFIPSATASALSASELARSFTNERADVYALGVMLHVALTGRVPIEGPTGSILLHQTRIREKLEPAPRPSLVAPGVPAALDELCARAIDMDRASRLASADELLKGLDAFLSSKDAGRESVVSRPPEASSSKRIVIAAASGAPRLLVRVSRWAARAAWRGYLRLGRRARVAVAAGLAAVVLVLVAGVLTTPRGWNGEPLPERLRRGKSAPALLWDTGRGFSRQMVWVPPGDFVMGAEDGPESHVADHGAGRSDRNGDPTGRSGRRVAQAAPR